MRLYIAILLLLAHPLCAAEPSRTETTRWLKEKLHNHLYYIKDGVDNRGVSIESVTFTDTSCILKYRSKSIGPDPAIFSTYTIPLAKLNREPEVRDAVHLQFPLTMLVLKTGGQNISMQSSLFDNRVVTVSSVEIGFTERSMAERVGKAFARLIMLSGGGRVKEPF